MNKKAPRSRHSVMIHFRATPWETQRLDWIAAELALPRGRVIRSAIAAFCVEPEPPAAARGKEADTG